MWVNLWTAFWIDRTEHFSKFGCKTFDSHHALNLSIDAAWWRPHLHPRWLPWSMPDVTSESFDLLFPYFTNWVLFDKYDLSHRIKLIGRLNVARFWINIPSAQFVECFAEIRILICRTSTWALEFILFWAKWVNSVRFDVVNLDSISPCWLDVILSWTRSRNLSLTKCSKTLARVWSLAMHRSFLFWILHLSWIYLKASFSRCGIFIGIKRIKW